MSAVVKDLGEILEELGSSIKKQVLWGTVILAGTGVVTRFLGLYNRVFLANIIGAGQIGIYQMIFPVFMVCNAVCCSGIETALSRLVATYGGMGCQKNVGRLVRIAVSLSMVLALLFAVGVFGGAEFISTYLLNEPKCAACLKVMSPVILFSTAHSCILGYFYGLKKTVIPASSQLVEQIFRVLAIYILAEAWYNQDADGALLAVFGMAAGDGISCIYTFIAYKIHVRGERKRTLSSRQPAAPYGFLFKKLMGDALPLTVNRLALTMLQSVEAVLIPAMMKLYYLAEGEAMEIYGIITGMAMPFITFPSTLTGSLASMLLPTVAEAVGRGDYSLVKRAVSKSLHYCLIIGILSMSIFGLYGNGLGTVFFNNSEAGQILAAFALLCPFLYTSASLASVLNGLGKTQMTLLHNVVSSGLRMIFIVALVPSMGISGYLWGMLASSILLCLLHTIQIGRICGLRFNVVKTLVVPFAGTVLGAFVSRAVYRWTLNAWSLSPIAVIAIPCFSMAVVYVLVLMAAGSIPSVNPLDFFMDRSQNNQTK